MTDYKCLYCPKIYKQKYNYNRHISVCRFLKSSEKEQQNEIELQGEHVPNLFELFQLVKEISLENEELKKRVQKLENRGNKEVKRVHIIEWLQTQKPCITFEKWLIQELYPNIEHHLEHVFQHDLLFGINKMLDTYFSTCKSVLLPICSYQKNKIINIYIYDVFDGNECWQQISHTLFDKYMSHMCDQFILTFNQVWYQENKEKIESNEKYKEKYIENYQKVLGGKHKKEIMYTKIRTMIAENVKKSPKLASINI